MTDQAQEEVAKSHGVREMGLETSSHNLHWFFVTLFGKLVDFLQ